MSTPAGVETIVGKDFEPEGSSVESQSEMLLMESRKHLERSVGLFWIENTAW